ncbi:MAG: serine/threonine-protein kinase [Cyanobacteria bacterium P01_A01_bin.135]
MDFLADSDSLDLDPAMADDAATTSQIDEARRSRTLFHSRYAVIRLLGRGGFGVTYLARDVALPGRPLCVIKQLCPKVQNPQVLLKARERFEREAKALAYLGSHSKIPQLLGYFEKDGQFYLVQEYVRGINLARYVKLNGTFNELQVRAFLNEVLPVVAFIHQHQVIHRDIKPPNIIRCQSDGRLVLIDFGAVKEEIAQIGGASPMTTQFVGTVGFAPPEQLALRPSYASDIYSLGVTCLYLLTGKPPLEMDYDVATGEILWQQMAPVSEYFAQVLSKMLKISPRDRYKSIAAVQRALDLESHVPSLNECLSSQPRTSTTEAKDDYLSPIQRTAQSIRELRSRLRRAYADPN